MYRRRTNNSKRAFIGLLPGANFMGIIDKLKSGVFSRLDEANARSKQMQEAQKRASENPIQQQHDYDAARRSILAEFSASPISACQKCVTNTKAAKRQERLDLVNRALISRPEHAAEAARLRQDMDEVENMRCADQVYLDNDKNAPPELRGQPPPGFLKPISEQLGKMGLDEDMLNPENSNFKAAVYMKDPAVWGDHPNPEAVLAFRGSTSAKEDWDNNFAQEANEESSYYRRAVTIGDQLRASNANIQIVGHSLGGGLASAAQGASGLNASTYNAAGLNSETVPRYLAELGEPARNAEKNKINAIRVKGEVLTQTQESFWGSDGLSLFANDAVGIKRDLDPATSQTDFDRLKSEGQVDAHESYDASLHGMNEVIAATEKQKSADESALKSALRN